MKLKVEQAVNEWRLRRTCQNSPELVEELKAHWFSVTNQKLNTYCTSCLREAMNSFVLSLGNIEPNPIENIPIVIEVPKKKKGRPFKNK